MSEIYADYPATQSRHRMTVGEIVQNVQEAAMSEEFIDRIAEKVAQKLANGTKEDVRKAIAEQLRPGGMLY